MTSRFLYTCSVVLTMLLLGGPSPLPASAQGTVRSEAPYALVVHGGAGTILPEQMTPELERQVRAALEAALQAGYAILSDGGSSLDAVEAAVRILEDDPHFNAGKGAVFTNQGTVELDASIMDGRTLSAGAVAGVEHVKNPIVLARRVMENSPHVLLVGDGAEAFARQLGLELVENSYFHTERRRRQLERIQAVEGGAQGGDGTPGEAGPTEKKHGTVGAVALDRAGNLAAATSTGGMTNKRFGRVGDSPLIGAGTYADNETCAVSATGHGEYFIRGVIAYDIAAMMDYTGLSLEEAASAVIHGKLTARGGTGGVIAIDRQGNIAMPFNTPGMYRGYIDTEGNRVIAFYRD